MTTTSVIYHILDVALTLQAPDPIRDAFDRVYGRFLSPCDCPACRAREPSPSRVVVAASSPGRYAVTSPWASAEVPEEQVFSCLLYLVQNHAVRRSRDFYTLHGACVEIDGRGCVLSAASCVGKTTLTVELVRRGAAFLSDEIAAIPVRDRGVHAYPRAVGLRPGSVGVLGLSVEVQQGFSTDIGELKHFLDMAALYPQRCPARTGLDLVVFLAPPPDPAGMQRDLESLEISLPDVPGRFPHDLERVDGVEKVLPLEDRNTPTLRILYRKGALIVRAVDRLAEACGVYITGHHRGWSLPIDYRAQPQSRVLTPEEGIKRVAANTLNLRSAASSMPAAVIGQLAGRFGRSRFVEVVPGSLTATAGMVEGMLGMT